MYWGPSESDKRKKNYRIGFMLGGGRKFQNTGNELDKTNDKIIIIFIDGDFSRLAVKTTVYTVY